MRLKNELIFSCNLVSLIRRGHSLYLKYHPNKKNELERAKEEIRNLLKFQIISVDGSFDDVMQENEWKNIKKSIESNGKLCVIEDVRKRSFFKRFRCSLKYCML